MLTIQKARALCSKGAACRHYAGKQPIDMRVTLLSYGATIQSIVVPGPGRPV